MLKNYLTYINSGIFLIFKRLLIFEYKIW